MQMLNFLLQILYQKCCELAALWLQQMHRIRAFVAAKFIPIRSNYAIEFAGNAANSSSIYIHL